jgi:hypothetical protein
MAAILNPITWKLDRSALGHFSWKLLWFSNVHCKPTPWVNTSVNLTAIHCLPLLKFNFKYVGFGIIQLWLNFTFLNCNNRTVFAEKLTNSVQLCFFLTVENSSWTCFYFPSFCGSRTHTLVFSPSWGYPLFCSAKFMQTFSFDYFRFIVVSIQFSQIFSNNEFLLSK